ncbi:secreted phosphoprotein 24 [Brienomyrus brachyistius]|uniref:secreted phosphoprotein 24 n=1 Tax=Brienomyrus brachyistius TaxID=42636 RepID=UPI0020B18112|nr:secreted phosphoprotein 24 [Brienomyrus brachyistius]
MCCGESERGGPRVSAEGYLRKDWWRENLFFFSPPRDMRVEVLLWVLLHALCSAGFLVPWHATPSAERQALGVALDHINQQAKGSWLYRVTRSSVKIIPKGLNSYEVMLKFGIRDTVCPRTSAVSPETCTVRPGISASVASCSSRVRLTGDLTELLSISCATASSSSSESSSEEMFAGLPHTDPWDPYGNGGLAPPILPRPTADWQNRDNQLNQNDLGLHE